MAANSILTAMTTQKSIRCNIPMVISQKPSIKFLISEEKNSYHRRHTSGNDILHFDTISHLIHKASSLASLCLLNKRDWDIESKGKRNQSPYEPQNVIQKQGYTPVRLSQLTSTLQVLLELVCCSPYLDNTNERPGQTEENIKTKHVENIKTKQPNM